VSVVRSSEADETIDQLGAGSLFGEVAMLSGGRRSASIRTAIPSVLVRIRGAELRSLMLEHTAIGDAIWGAFAARLFDDHLRGLARSSRQGLPELDRMARDAWSRRGRHEDLAQGVDVVTDGDAFLLMLRGSASIQQGTTQISAQAPIVIELDASTRVIATTAARVVHVPPLTMPGEAMDQIG
jgi:CRP-like cAMP-binding protein